MPEPEFRKIPIIMADDIRDYRPHYAVKMVDLPPTSITCKCGEEFDEGDVITAILSHMHRLNPPPHDGEIC